MFDSRTQPIYDLDERTPYADLYQKPDALNQFWNKAETESDRLKQLFDKRTFLQLVEYLISEVELICKG